MTKIELLKEIYRVENEIREIKGQPKVEKTEYKLYKEADINSKSTLESWLEKTKNSLTETKVEIYRNKRAEEFYSTPAGQQIKKNIEKAIDKKIEEWKAYEKTVMECIEHNIKVQLGAHWAVCRFNTGFVEIGIVNPKTSTPERKEFFFGQTLEIRYEQKSWLNDGQESFQTNIGGCGGFSIEGGDTLGDRAMFYIGAGLLFSNKELIRDLKYQLSTSAEYHEKANKELETLRRQLNNPFEN